MISSQFYEFRNLFYPFSFSFLNFIFFCFLIPISLEIKIRSERNIFVTYF